MGTQAEVRVSDTPLYDALKNGWTGEPEGLSDRIDALQEDYDGCYAVFGLLARNLDAITLALKGPPPPLTSWSQHDLVDWIEALKHERDEALLIATASGIAFEDMRHERNRLRGDAPAE